MRSLFNTFCTDIKKYKYFQRDVCTQKKTNNAFSKQEKKRKKIN